LTAAPGVLGGLPAAVATVNPPGVAVSDQPWRLVVKKVPQALGTDVTIGGGTVRRFTEGVLADAGLVFAYTF
jgi:hypothetical protein